MECAHGLGRLLQVPGIGARRRAASQGEHRAVERHAIEHGENGDGAPRAPARWGTGRRPGGPPSRKEGFGAPARLESLTTYGAERTPRSRANAPLLVCSVSDLLRTF